MVKKILIVSDSHGRSQNIKAAIDIERPDMLIHLGDIEDDPEVVRRWLDETMKTSVPAVFVQGNCDGYKGLKLQSTAVFELNDHRFYCTHGHRQGVNMGLENLMYSALENDCDIAMYGHTHVPFDDYFESFGDVGSGVRILNPGSISIPRGGSKRSYMILTFTDDGEINVEQKNLKLS